MSGSDPLSAPLTVNWSLSYRCNFTCRHCYSRNMETERMTPEKVRRAVDLLAEKGVIFINFGGGEPLLVPDIMEIAAYAVSKGLRVSMNSNGWCVDEDTAREIARAGFTSVGISIDSPDPVSHDRFRNRRGSFSRAIRALDLLRAARVKTTVSCVINRNNLSGWQGMLDVCRDHGAGTLYLHNYKCTGSGFVNMGDLDLTPAQWEAFYTEALRVRSSHEEVTLSFDDPIMAALPGFQPSGTVPGSTCGKLSLHLCPDGQITPCGFIPLSVGHILEDDFDEIWFRSPILQKMREKTPEGKCHGCSSYSDCLGGCTARVFALTGAFDGPDPHCWVEED